ncbi:MAG TPA: M56 family metallopeptidase, partial [Puia sp.]
MRVSFLFSLFREDIVRALFWTLVHSLWQGLALAILTGLVILFTRRSAPVWRYNILLGVLCLFIAGAGTTFFLELRVPVAASDAASGSGSIYYAAPPADTPVASAVYAGTGQSWGERLILFFNQRANMIVAIWFVILAIRLMKLLADLWTVQRLRYYRTSAPAAYWSDRVTELAQRIGIKRAVRILESSAIKAPMMAGVLKPVILTPLGLLAQLPVQEMEAILLHELAHIRRKDYLTNLLQCFAEVLFFFNPAVLWISSLIREERENCCDDIAVGETNSKKDLINALVSFQEYRHSRYTLAFAGGKDHLLRRVRRIVHRDDKTLDVREKIFLLTCLFMMAGLVMAYPRQTPVVVKAPKVETIWQAPPVEDVPIADVVGPEKPVKMEKPAKMQETRRPGERTMVAVADTSKKPAAGKDTAGTEKEREWDRILDQQRKELEAQQQRLNEESAKLAAKQRELEMEQAKLKLEYLKANKDTLTLLQQDALSKLRLAEAGAMLDRK